MDADICLHAAKPASSLVRRVPFLELVGGLFMQDDLGFSLLMLSFRDVCINFAVPAHCTYQLRCGVDVHAYQKQFYSWVCV